MRKLAATPALLIAIGLAACGSNGAASGSAAPSASPSASASAAGQPAKTHLKVGDPAPPFDLAGSDGKTHKLSDHLGQRAVVLAWFPKAFTGG
jgi:hypothetical protein